MTHNQIFCLENQTASRWLRTVEYQNQLFVIDSNFYGVPTLGYAMKFANSDEFSQWLEVQKNQGWSVTFHDEDQPNPVSVEQLQALQTATFDILKKAH